MTAIRLPEDWCPRCGYKLDAASPMKEGQVPTPGSFSICMRCAGVNVFGDGLRIRRATDDEEAGLLASPMGVQVLRLRAEIRKLKLGRLPRR